MYILDEPTTGLHFHDILQLLNVLQRLVDQGNSIIIIEHNMDVIKSADYIINMGPEGGDLGGYIIAEGTPEEIAQDPKSYTGQYLKPILNDAHQKDQIEYVLERQQMPVPKSQLNNNRNPFAKVKNDVDDDLEDLIELEDESEHPKKKSKRKRVLKKQLRRNGNPFKIERFLCNMLTWFFY